MNRKGIAEFSKVSKEQFYKDMHNCMPNIPDEEIERIYNNIEIPTRATVGSAGYDFKTPMETYLCPGETITIPTGIRCSIADDWMLILLPKSGLGYKYKMQLDNTIGLIDSDYYKSENEGHIFVKITNDSRENKPILLGMGDKFIQGVFTIYGTAIEEEVKEVRNGGLGSTGK